jgi:signal transduction histidine kinase/DNA-binding response OmpR family regulator
MSTLGHILLVGDEPRDIELTLTALDQHRLANEVVGTRDSEEALDCHYSRGDFETRTSENSAAVLLDLKLPKADGLEGLQQIKSQQTVKFPLHILYLEDDPNDADLVQATLEDEGVVCAVKRVETEADFCSSLEPGGFDLIFADYTLPEFDGISALKITRQSWPDVPFIIVSGTLDEEVAIEALKIGATDYVFKTRLSRIAPSVQRAILEAKERTERRRAEQRIVAQHTVTQILAEAATLEEAAPKILQAVCECLVWDLGELWRTDRGAGVLRCVETWHRESIEASQFAAASRDRTFMPGIGLPGRVWSSREPAYIPDVVADSNFPRAPIAAREGLHAAFAFPIQLSNEVVGVMDFFSQEIRQPDQDLLDMMTTIGSQIGQFIERKRAEEELRRSEAYLAAAQRLSHTGSFGWEASSGEISCSQETFRIFECEPPTKPTLELVLQRTHPEDRSAVRQLIERVSREGETFDFEHRLLMPDGSVKHLRVVGHPSKDDRSEFVGAVTDITERKRAQGLLEDYGRTLERKVQELREKQAQLVQAGKMAALGNLAAGVAHEINTPLGVLHSNNDIVHRSISRIKGILQNCRAALEEQKSLKLHQLVEHIERMGQVNRTAAQRIMNIVSGLKSFARLDQEAEDRVDIHEGLDITLTLVNHQLKDRISVHRHYCSLPKIHCRPRQLNEVYMNILVNAIQAIEGRGDIHITTCTRDDRAVVEILDTGRGIPEENLSRIFDPGFTTKGVKVGTGIGLSIAYRIVEDHNGSIEVESEVGKGSTFKIILPLGQPCAASIR